VCSSDLLVPVLSSSRKEKRLGGAANVALNLQALGATPILCSVVGDDYDGQTFERLLNYQGMPNKGIIRSQNRITTNKLRILSGSQQFLQVDTEDDHPLIDLDRKALLHHILDLSDECDLIIFEDYDKGTIHSEIISETINIAKEKSIPVAVDPKSQNFLSYKGATLFKPGLSELEGTSKEKIDIKRAEGLKKAVDKIDQQIGAGNYILSLEGGDTYYQSKELSEIYPSHHSGISDMAGVGNAVISVAGLGLTMDLPSESIAELANIAGSLVAQYTGVVPLQKDQFLKEALKSEILKKYL